MEKILKRVEMLLKKKSRKIFLKTDLWNFGLITLLNHKDVISCIVSFIKFYLYNYII